MIGSPPEYGCKVLLQCVTIVGVVRIFFETVEEIRCRQRLSGFDLPVCNFLRIGIDDRGRAPSPASRESPSGKRHIGTMKTVSARQANHEFSDLLSRVEHGEEILITKASRLRF